MLSLKTACFAIIGALVCSGTAIVFGLLVLFILAALLEKLLGIGEVAWYGIYIGPLFATIGLLVGAYYGAVLALRTSGYSLRDYGRSIWAFLVNE